MDVCVVLYRCGAERVEAGLRPGDQLLTVDNTDRNRGFAVGSNLAASRGKDPLICFVNPDGILSAGCLDGLEAAFDDPEVVAAGPSLGTVDVALHPDGSPAFLSGCCLAVRRAAFERVGGFDERFFMYGEDFDICARTQLAGWKLQVGEDLLARHDAQRASRTDSRHLYWHVSSLLKVWVSGSFWRFRRQVERGAA